MAEIIIYRMLIDCAGYNKGDWWEKGTEPPIVEAWAKQGGGSFKEQKIISIEKRDPLDLGEKKTEGHHFVCPKCGYSSKDSESDSSENDSTDFKTVEDLKKPSDSEKEIIKCKGFNKDGSPCKFTGNKVLKNGYCGKHQDQASKDEDDGQKSGSETVIIDLEDNESIEKPEEGES